jgi:DNA topoisomerase-1
LERALEVLAGGGAKKGRAGARSVRNNTKNILKALGEHPDGGAIQVLDGRYGPYVNYKKLNVTLPKNVLPESVTLEQALTWLAAKQEKPRPRRKKAR